ncbi:hypothetical protein [Pedobacter nototheniae]|uniref:hypothetical protein n=1 Tax=Pedobacter nototheniae TaxID=2488994 RepID=UPI001040CBCB|nr:hypothetical protein [Pedobacter nototheniae]
MRNQFTKPLALNKWFSLPFTANSFTLSLNTLNGLSAYRKISNPYTLVNLQGLNFTHGILELAVQLNKEPVEKVYLNVTPTALLVSCSVNTTDIYLSRYTYFALRDLIGVAEQYSFEIYYWPNFFKENGKSDYLKITKAKQGLCISQKAGYSFLKPSTVLPKLNLAEPATLSPLWFIDEKPNVTQPYTVGFCLAYTDLKRWHTQHYPFLIPYWAKLTQNKTAIKYFNGFVGTGSTAPAFVLSQTQSLLMDICKQMQTLALIQQHAFTANSLNIDAINRANVLKQRNLFVLYQQALPLLSRQLFSFYYCTHGMRNVKGKPQKQLLIPCYFASDVPVLCFILKQRGEYIELQLKFKIGTRSYTLPNNFIVGFFVAAKQMPSRFYLLRSFRDYSLVAFFVAYNFKICVLKVHWVYFEEFLKELSRLYFSNIPTVDVNTG